MTEKERRAAFHDESLWMLSLRFPQSEAFRVMEFKFYSLTVYELQMLTVITWDHEHMKPCNRNGWEHKFYFVEGKNNGSQCFNAVGMTAIWDLMKESEKKEKES